MSIVVVPEFAVLCVTVAWMLLFALLLVITNVIPPPEQAPLGLMERSALASARASATPVRQSKYPVIRISHDLYCLLIRMDQFLPSRVLGSE